jgi:hypothetical protein
MEYLSKVAHVQIHDPVFEGYYEVKATRDLLVHSDRQINALYIEKAGRRRRGEIGESVEVDSDYFDSSLAVMKQISGIVKRDIEKAFRPSMNKERSYDS